ncbi:MAG: RloB family protein [Prevotella sp.]|nr:RloB family protein [Prevotella sp.]
MARKINSRQTRKPQKRVVGAGLTEYWYLKHLKPLIGLKFELYPRLFGNETMGKINKLIEEGLNDNADVICFFDEDIMQWDSVEKERIKGLHHKYDNDSHVTLACSMPSIEYWFLLHYENTNRYFANSHEVINVLHRYITHFDKKESFLKHQKWVVELINDNKMEIAMQRAEFFGRNGASYSDIWKAIKAMK